MARYSAWEEEKRPPDTRLMAQVARGIRSASVLHLNWRLRLHQLSWTDPASVSKSFAAGGGAAGVLGHFTGPTDWTGTKSTGFLPFISTMCTSCQPRPTSS